MAAAGGDAWSNELEAMGEAPGVQRCKEPLGPSSGPVCVTGCSGFIALHLVQQLLDKSYTVVGTVRSTSDENKMAPLLEMQKKHGEDKFRIVPGVDCTKPETFEAAVAGCAGVFHTASPFHFQTEDPMTDLVKPAQMGTEGCLIACKKAAGMKRVVVTASFACIMNAGVYPNDYTYSSKDWNKVSRPAADGKFPEPVGNHGYRYSKIMGEKAAWDFARAEDCPFDVACINPPFVIGKNYNKCKTPDDLNTSSGLVLGILSGKIPPVPNSTAWVDVVDVARAHIAAYEHPEAGGRRFLCAADEVPTWTEVSGWLKEIGPSCPVVVDAPAAGEGVRMTMDCSALKSLSGFTFTPLKETLRAQAESLVDLGFVGKL